MFKNLKTCRYLIKFSYIGTKYKGVQRLTKRLNGEDQEDGSIQSVLERAMNRALLPVYGTRLALSSRTDAGVHALMNYANADLTHPFCNTLYKPSFITSSVNHILHSNHHQITVLETHIVPTYFHSRINAKSRSYIYRIAVPKFLPIDAKKENFKLHYLLPVSQLQRCHILNNPLNMELVKKCIDIFLGEHDFVAFATPEKNSNAPRPTVKTIDRLELYKFQLNYEEIGKKYCDNSSKLEYYEIFIKSKSFLFNQVRRMVSTILDVGMGNIQLEDVNKMLENGKTYRPSGLSVMVPPCGLYLVDVEYDPSEFELHENFNEYAPKAYYQNDTFES